MKAKLLKLVKWIVITCIALAGWFFLQSKEPETIRFIFLLGIIGYFYYLIEKKLEEGKKFSCIFKKNVTIHKNPNSDEEDNLVVLLERKIDIPFQPFLGLNYGDLIAIKEKYHYPEEFFSGSVKEIHYDAFSSLFTCTTEPTKNCSDNYKYFVNSVLTLLKAGWCISYADREIVNEIKQRLNQWQKEVEEIEGAVKYFQEMELIQIHAIRKNIRG